MELQVAFTARQLALLRDARDRDAPDQIIEEYIARAYGAEAERRDLDLADDDELD